MTPVPVHRKLTTGAHYGRSKRPVPLQQAPGDHRLLSEAAGQ